MPATHEILLKTDLKRPITVQPLHGLLFSADNQGDKVGFEVYDDGVPVTLTTDIEGTYLASWMQDGRFHSVGLIAKNNAQTILPIVSEILAQKPDAQ